MPATSSITTRIRDMAVGFAVPLTGFLAGACVLPARPVEPKACGQKVRAVDDVVDDVNATSTTQARPEIRRPLEIELQLTWRAVLWVESRNGRDKRCYRENAEGSLGPAQITRGCLKDINRILGRQVYASNDRLDIFKSFDMFRVYVLHYWPVARGGCPETWARTWNGGPNGPAKKATERYWRRCTEVLDGRAGESAGLADHDGRGGQTAHERATTPR